MSLTFVENDRGCSAEGSELEGGGGISSRDGILVCTMEGISRNSHLFFLSFSRASNRPFQPAADPSSPRSSVIFRYALDDYDGFFESCPART